MAITSRRSGDKNALWDNVAVGAGGTSAAIELPRGTENLVLYITTGGATTVTLEASHSGDITSEGILPDSNAGNWGQVYSGSSASPIQVVFGAAGVAVLLVPDFTPGWIRLRSSAAVTITAGWEAAAG